MFANIKELWKAALRGGEYKQGQGALRSLCLRTGTFEYCCLGVLTDLYAKANNCTFEQACEGNYEGHNENSYLSDKVAIWAGFVDGYGHVACDPVLIPFEQSSPVKRDGLCSQINDAGTSFNRIADLIDRNL